MRAKDMITDGKTQYAYKTGIYSGAHRVVIFGVNLSRRGLMDGVRAMFVREDGTPVHPKSDSPHGGFTMLARAREIVDTWEGYHAKRRVQEEEVKAERKAQEEEDERWLQENHAEFYVAVLDLNARLEQEGVEPIKVVFPPPYLRDRKGPTVRGLTVDQVKALALMV